MKSIPLLGNTQSESVKFLLALQEYNLNIAPHYRSKGKTYCCCCHCSQQTRLKQFASYSNFGCMSGLCSNQLTVSEGIKVSPQQLRGEILCKCGLPKIFLSLVVFFRKLRVVVCVHCILLKILQNFYGIASHIKKTPFWTQTVLHCKTFTFQMAKASILAFSYHKTLQPNTTHKFLCQGNACSQTGNRAGAASGWWEDVPRLQPLRLHKQKFKPPQKSYAGSQWREAIYLNPM